MADHEKNEVVEILILIHISSQQNPINMRTLQKSNNNKNCKIKKNLHNNFSYKTILRYLNVQNL